MFEKTPTVFACLLAFATAANIASVPNVLPLEARAANTSNATNASHHLIVGSRVWGDVILSQQVVTKSSSWLQIVTREVNFTTPRNQTITLVKALDQKTNGNGAYASITYGGPGNRNVTVRFKSQRGHGISFLLEIYGR